MRPRSAQAAPGNRFEIPLAPSGKSPIALRASRARSRGAFRDRHERWARDAMDAGASPDERRQRGRRSRVVLMPRRWHQVGGAIRQRWWQESPITRESAKEAVKTNRAGKAGLFRRTCGDYARVLYSFGREAAGAHKHPAFPAPSIDEGRYFPAKLGQNMPRECGATSRRLFDN